MRSGSKLGGEDGEVGPVARREPPAVGEAENLSGNEARHPGRLGEPEARHAADDGGAAAVAAEQRAVQPLVRGGHEVARERDAPRPATRTASSSTRGCRWRPSGIRPIVARSSRSRVRTGPGERALGGLIAFQRCVAKRAPASRAAPSWSGRSPACGRARRRSRPRPAARRPPARGELGRQRDEADEAARRPLVDGAEIDRRQLARRGWRPPPRGSGRAPRDGGRGRGGRPPPRPSSWRADSP